MKLRILMIVFVLAIGWWVIRLTQTTRPVIHNSARADEAPPAAGPANAAAPVAEQSPLKPYLLILEADWSASPHPDQI